MGIFDIIIIFPANSFLFNEPPKVVLIDSYIFSSFYSVSKGKLGSSTAENHYEIPAKKTVSIKQRDKRTFQLQTEWKSPGAFRPKKTDRLESIMEMNH